MYWPRILEKTIAETEKSFPVTVITGPRQSGKSTLLKHYFPGRKATFLSLDDPNFRNLLSDDPLPYLENLKKPVVIDEIQYMPQLATFVKILVDKNRTPGQWFITGSHQFSVMKDVSESLAGRAAILSLPTFQIRERRNITDIGNYLLRGSYPEIAVNRKLNSDIWYSSYVQTYLERDLRSMMSISSLRDFENVLRLLAAHTAQELNYSSIANQLGISVPTIKRWLSVLEASYIIFLLPPFFNNYGKRIIKSPKIYFYDVGLANYLVGIKDIDFLLKGPMAGALFETAVVSEIVKAEYAKGVKPELYFWRSQSGIEIDLIRPEKSYYVPYEIKISSTIKPEFYKNINYWIELSGQQNKKGYLITNCNQDLPLPKNIKNIYWKDL